MLKYLQTNEFKFDVEQLSLEFFLIDKQFTDDNDIKNTIQTFYATKKLKF